MRRRELAVILLISIGFSVWGWTEDDFLAVATAWPVIERTRFEEDYRRWVASTKGQPSAIRWEILSRGDDLSRVASRRSPPDLILGGPAATYGRLSAEGRLAANEAGTDWRVAKRLPMGLAVRRREASKNDASGPAPAAPSRRLAFDDPRRDPVALDWAKAVLRSGSWAEGYSRLVRQAGGPTAPGRQPGASLAAVRRGYADETPVFGSPLDNKDATRRGTAFVAVSDWPDWVEGAAALKGAPHETRAVQFLEHLVVTGRVEPLPSAVDTRPEADRVLADLLGSTLVEARDELLDAWKALEVAGRPERAEMWLTRAPPWPPASVAILLANDENGMALVETLATQITPDSDLRAWLLRSWIAPARLVDDRLLDEMANAGDGRLALEPRFRAWLRGEWTSWARQRYRRVARSALSSGKWGSSS